MRAVADKALVERPDGTLEVESTKNHVHLLKDRVIKSFVSGKRSTKRFRREVEALERLRGMDGFPALLEQSKNPHRVHISRLPGQPLAGLEAAPDSVYVTLRTLVDQMLQAGVARHSLPPRDVIVRPDGSAGLVDFERSRCRRVRFGPIWLVSSAVTRFQLLRLLGEAAPHLLSDKERSQLQARSRLRAVYRQYLDLRKQYKRR